MKYFSIIVFILFILLFINENNIACVNGSGQNFLLAQYYSDNDYEKAITLSAKVLVKQKISCNGICDGVLRVNVISGVPPYKYLWSTGKTLAATNPLCTGTYTVTVTDATGSTITVSKYLSQPAKLIPGYNKTEITASGANDGAIAWITSGGTSPYNYVWNDGYISGNRTGIPPGSYTITITDARGCEKSVKVVWENPSFANKILYITQMHIHGWSNHNGWGWTKPGSLQYHNKQADSSGVNIIWWTEHHGIFTQSALSFPFTGALVNPVSLNIENLPSLQEWIPNKWKCLTRQGTCSASVNADTLQLSIHSATSNSTFKTFSYTPRHNSNLIDHYDFVKPLAARPVLQLMLRPSFGNVDDTRIEFVFKLAWHLRSNMERQDVITYQIVDSSYAPSAVTNGLDSVTIVLPVKNNTWQQVQLNLADAAALLDHGIDNTLSEYEVKLLSKKGGYLSSDFTDIRLVPFQSNSDSLVNAEKAELNYNNSLYHGHNIFGIEYSGRQHMNGFFPDTVNNIDLFTGIINGNISNWVQTVHQQGGVVSYNHPFFPGERWKVDPAPIQDYRVDTMATHILSNQAYQSDILEVGYFQRGYVDLKHHLQLWDILTANGLFLYGNGVSDAHGSWIDELNLYHTFIYSVDTSSYELLHGLSLGHMFFANIKSFNSRFHYSLGNLEMGDRGFSNQSDAIPVIHLDPFPPKCKIKMTQVLLNNSNQLTYLHNLTIIDTSALPMLNFSQPCFVRFAIYDSLDYPLAFGQPIVIMGVTVNKQVWQDDSTGVDIKTYPNPVDEFLNLELDFSEHGNYMITLLDAKSNVVRQVDERYFYLGKYGYRIDVKDLAPATYILSVTNDKKSTSQKVIIH